MLEVGLRIDGTEVPEAELQSGPQATQHYERRQGDKKGTSTGTSETSFFCPYLMGTTLKLEDLEFVRWLDSKEAEKFWDRD